MPTSSFLAQTGLRPRPAASDAAIVAAEQSVGQAFPADYRAFLRESNGIEGFVDDVYLTLWPVEDVREVAAVNREVPEFVPGLVMLGGDGGGEGLGFIAERGRSRYVQVPVVGLGPDLMETLGGSLVEVLALLRARGWGPALGHFAGELSPWPSKEQLAAHLRDGGLRVVVGRYSLRVEDCSQWSFENYGGDIADPSIDADAKTVERLLRDAALVSGALARANITHRFEVYDGDRVLKGYFHHDWPRPADRSP